MKRRPLTRSELLARMPRGLRPKLDGAQRRDLALCHIVNLDAIATGQAESGILWDWVGSVFAWSRAAELSGIGEEEMKAQLEVAARLIERFHRTGKVRFDGQDYQLAKRGLQVMDELAAIVDRATASTAVEWSEDQVNAIAMRAATVAPVVTASQEQRA